MNDQQTPLLQKVREEIQNLRAEKTRLEKSIVTTLATLPSNVVSS